MNLEKQKENFKNHRAIFKDLGNIKILDFKKPNRLEMLFTLEKRKKVPIKGVDIREICDLTDSVTSAECLKNTLLRMGYEIICTNDISRYNDRYELIPKFDKTYQIKVPFVSREKENMLLARALCEIQTGIHNDMECKIIARRLLMPKQEFLDQIKKNEDVSGRVNLTNIARHFCVDESVVSSLGVDLNLLSIF